jgi:hypothetical protein
VSRPILVVGASPHAGGDVVAQRLVRHPDLHLVPATDLGALAAGAGRILHGARDIAGDGVSHLAEELGAPLLTWLRNRARMDGEGRPVVSITSPHDLHPLLALLPACDLVLVVRDGQDAVAAARARGTGFERAVRTWLEGTRAILAVTGRPLPSHTRARLVRYEDLTTDGAAPLVWLLDWLGLPDSSAVREGRLPLDAAVPSLTVTEQARFALRAATASRSLGYPVPRTDVANTAVAGMIESGYAARRAIGRLVT